jgi:prepilin-type N-terminal cleavage/methylation domain-containing protein
MAPKVAKVRTPISNRVHGPKGFTYIEMCVVIVILLILAALTVPNVVKMQETSVHEQFFGDMWRLAGTARQMGISEHKTMILTLDESGRQFRILEQADQTAANTDGTQADDTERKTLAIPEGIETGNSQAGSSSSTSNDWEIRFYPDGSSDGGGLEVTDNGRVRSLLIKPTGQISILDGELPTQDTDSWPAGDFEHRT